MRPDVEEKLLSINREFYQTFAASFAESRRRPQPGTSKLLTKVTPDKAVLDLGCGNGALADSLHNKGHHSKYIGLDNSPALLAAARQSCRHPQAEFRLADLATPEWSTAIVEQRFPWIFALAVLHHIPGNQRRLAWATRLKMHLAEDAMVGISVWNFPAEPRWRGRILPWSTVGLTDEMVEEGDALLDWRRGGLGLRYVHHFEANELAGLAVAAGCRVVDQLEAGGRSGKLNRLQLWQRQPAA